MLLLMFFITAALAQTKQLLLVISPDWNSKEATIRRFEMNDATSTWSPVGHTMNAVIGKNGLGWGQGVHKVNPLRDEPVKREGDGKAPAGIFELGSAFGYEPLIRGIRLPFTTLSLDDVCVDDVGSPNYNKFAKKSLGEADWKTAEEMRRKDELYRYGLVVLHNARPIVPSRGSCIFLHIWRSSLEGTAGCTATSENNVVTILRWLDPMKNPRLIQLPKARYDLLKVKWGLP